VAQRGHKLKCTAHKDVASVPFSFKAGGDAAKTSCRQRGALL